MAKSLNSPVKDAIVGETAQCGDGVERGEGSVAGWFAGIAAGSLAVARDCDSVAAGAGGDVAWARRYGALVKGGDVGFDANVDGIVAIALISC